MTISLKADASGNSGSIQVGGNDKLIVNADGSLVAAVNPATGVRSNALATMQKFADEFGASLAGNGYQKLPSGLIVQWGSASVSATSVLNVTLPIAFPTAFVCAMANSNVTGGYSEPVSAYANSLSQVAIRNNNGATHTAAWFAIGY